MPVSWQILPASSVPCVHGLQQEIRQYFNAEIVRLRVLLVEWDKECLQNHIESIEERSIQGRGDRDGRAISQTISDFLTICQELNYISDPVRLIQNAVQAVGSFMNFDYNRVNLIQPDRSFVCIASFSKKGDGASLVGSTLPTQRTSLYTELMQTGMTIFPFWAGDDGSHEQQIAISSEEQQQLFLVPLCANARNLGTRKLG